MKFLTAVSAQSAFAINCPDQKVGEGPSPSLWEPQSALDAGATVRR